MLIFRPLEVEGRKVAGFVDWKPESTEYVSYNYCIATISSWDEIL